MPGLVPGIHDFRRRSKKVVDGRLSPFSFVIPAKAGIQPAAPPL
jgi:hypothetical protein